MSTSIYANGVYKNNNPSWHVEDSEWKAEQILKGLRVYGLSPKSICEVGCGAGEILNNLYQRMDPEVRFTGFEISRQAHQLCTQLTKDRLEFVQGDILSDDVKFDLMLAIDVFEHVPDYIGFLMKLREKARTFVFHVPLELTVRGLLFGDLLMASRTTMGHLHYFDRNSALAALEDCGYTILGDYYTFWQEDLPHRRPKSKIERLMMKGLKAKSEHLAVRLLGGHSLMVVARC